MVSSAAADTQSEAVEGSGKSATMDKLELELAMPSDDEEEAATEEHTEQPTGSMDEEPAVDVRGIGQASPAMERIDASAGEDKNLVDQVLDDVGGDDELDYDFDEDLPDSPDIDLVDEKGV